jgi:hypothetical protein
MKLFKRKRQESESKTDNILEKLSLPVCQQSDPPQHFWRDFPPYITYTNSARNGTEIKVNEDYVCIYCKQRKTEVLQLRKSERMMSQEELEKEIKKIETENKELNIKPIAVVRDMIMDTMYVDRMKLDIWDKIRAPKPTTEEEKFKLTIEKDYGEII